MESFNGVYIKPGIELGVTATFGDDASEGTGLNLGGEVSAVVVRAPFFFGGVVDGLYDWHRDGWRVAVGPTAGWQALGVDVGYLAELSGEETRHGVAVRPFVYLAGVLILYGRYGVLVGAADFAEMGIELKLPIDVARW